MTSQWRMRERSNKRPMYIYEVYEGAEKVDEGQLKDLAKRLYISEGSINRCYIMDKLLFKRYRIDRRENET